MQKVLLTGRSAYACLYSQHRCGPPQTRALWSNNICFFLGVVPESFAQGHSFMRHPLRIERQFLWNWRLEIIGYRLTPVFSSVFIQRRPVNSCSFSHANERQPAMKIQDPVKVKVGVRLSSVAAALYETRKATISECCFGLDENSDSWARLENTDYNWNTGVWTKFLLALPDSAIPAGIARFIK